MSDTDGDRRVVQNNENKKCMVVKKDQNNI